MNTWDLEDAYNTYLINHWGAGYFGINDLGNMVVRPMKKEPIDLIKITEQLKANHNVVAPFILRFHDILHSRVIELNQAFENAIKEYGYKNRYLGVFPIKVNQLREVVEEILAAGEKYQFGLEAGSKPELLAALSTAKNNNQSLIICNGYKDSSFIENALYGRKLGHNVIIVIEKPSEADLIIEVAKKVNIQPVIGIRSKLYSRGGGKWEKSAGDDSKFGLSTVEILEAYKKFINAGMKDAFQLLHFHLGSQIPNIRRIANAAREAARVYANLKQLGVQLKFIDVGGGLGVDYDGSKTNFDSSMNYSLQEYANDIVYNMMDVCNEENVEHPTIVSESGRAIVAHHSMLVLSVKDVIEQGSPSHMSDITGEPEEKVVKDLKEISETISIKNYQECYNDIVTLREEAFNLFNLGYLSFMDRARVESYFWDAARKVVRFSKQAKNVSPDIEALYHAVSDKYVCNFSVFQSMMDHWAIGHLFPIVPLQRLKERPNHLGIIVDITCDSDGKIDKFIDRKDVKDALELHEIKKGEDYYLGVFLVGAYQDILGDFHNLFGYLDEVHVFQNEDGSPYIETVIEGHTCGDILELVQYNKEKLIQNIVEKTKANNIPEAVAQEIVEVYKKGINDYTYLA